MHSTYIKITLEIFSPALGRKTLQYYL